MFTKVKLGSLCEIRSSRRIYESEYVNFGIPFIRGQEISDESIANENADFECYISEARYDQLKAQYGVPQKGDILITAVGTIGNLYYVDTNRKFYFKDGNVIWLRKFKNDIAPRYLYYFMNSSYFKKQLTYSLIGAVQKALTMDMLEEIDVLVPIDAFGNFDLPYQGKICKVLSRIETKIITNNCINTELESLAKTIYEYWFLQFDFPNKEGKPYKSSGGAMVWNEDLKMEIPEGWRTEKIIALADIYQPLTISNSLMNDSYPYPVYGGGGFIGRYNRYNHENTEIIISCRGTCGEILQTMPKSWITGNAMVVHPTNENIPQNYLYHFLKTYGVSKYLTGSVQKQLTRENLAMMPIMCPSRDVVNKFEKFAKLIQEMIINITLENENLVRTRDFLLPLLMNGQVGFKDA